MILTKVPLDWTKDSDDTFNAVMRIISIFVAKCPQVFVVDDYQTKKLSMNLLKPFLNKKC